MSTQGGDERSERRPHRCREEGVDGHWGLDDASWGESLACVLQAGGVGYWRYEVASGRLSCSAVCKASFGLDPEDELTSIDQLRAHIHPEDLAPVDEGLHRAISDGDDYVLQHRVLTPSGEVRWVMTRGRVFRRSGDDAIMEGITVDITEHKLVEAERERLIAELAAERARLRALVDHMPAAVVVGDASGRIVFANPAVDSVFPLPHPPLPAESDELFSAWYARHADGRPLEAHERPISRALRGEKVDPEDYLFLRADGTEAWIRLSSAPILDDSGAVTGGVVIASDVDREKRAAEALRASESRHRQLFESPVIGIIHALVDGRITNANDTFLESFGYTGEDLLAGRLNWRSMTPPEHREADDLGLEELLTTGSHLLYEKEFLRKDGTRVPIVLGGTMIEDSKTEIVTFVLDISDRKRADAERESLLHSLERSEERYRLAALATEDVIYDWDLRTDRVSDHTMFGHARDSVTWADRIHPDDREAVVTGLRAAVESCDRHWQAEYRFRKSNGSWAVVSDRGYLTYDGQGRPARIVGAMQDVTARRRQEEFERQLIGIVSHDLKNPLNTIMLAAGMMVRSEDRDERTMKNAMRIQVAAERATRMIRDLLDFTRARLGAGIPIERRRVGLGPIFQGVVDEVCSGHPERSIVFQSSGDCTGAFDADRLVQVLTNLIENALGYSPAGSVVCVMLRGEPDEVLLTVHNDGPAIAAELLPRIFEPLQRGEAAFDPTGRSVGLGLYIVKHLVEAHGGRVEVRSAEGEGTEFNVRLPR